VKILYISEGAVHEYMCDMLFHGLRSLLGADVVDVNCMEFMYKDTIHGGYTLWGLLPNLGVDREDIPGKIRNRYFDLVIYGMAHIWRAYLDEVIAAYPPSRIVFVDGCDDHNVAPVQGKGLYFKRELSEDRPPGILSIQFGIPKEKVRLEIPKKVRLMAPLDPADRSTYGYVTEESYYQQYCESYFGRTMKKGGWDCLRHYEIIAAGCLPYFVGLEACPPRTLEHLPKADLLQAKQLHDNWRGEDGAWQELMLRVRATLLEDLTTEALARRLLEKVV